MNATISRLALQALVGRRRFWALLAFPIGLVGLAVMLRLLTGDASAYGVVPQVGYALVLPLVALLATAAVLGPEVDDGSIVYLLAKPVGRHTVVLSKYVVAWAATMLAGALPLFLAGLVLDGGEVGRSAGWGVAAAAAGTAYSALFLALSAITRYAVVIGLLFVLLWEGLLGGLLAGIAWLSIRQWGARVGELVDSGVAGPSLGVAYAVAALAVVTVAALWYAGDRLRSFTVRGDE